MLLGVNIDHCATIRQARYKDEQRDCGGNVEPDPVAMAQIAERAGADGITVHLREDRRHIQESDVARLRACINTRMNLEMACTDEMIEYALDIKPESVCLVPESREEVTTEGGLDVIGNRDKVSAAIEAFNDAGIKTSLFIDPSPEQIKVSAEINAPWIELHTGAFANAYFDSLQCEKEFEKLATGVQLGLDLNLVVNAGHGINYVNIQRINELVGLNELNIGHSILSRAMFTGIEEAVMEMKQRMC